MPFERPPPPFDRTALEPHLSADAVDQIWARYVAHLAALEALLPDPDATPALEDLLRTAQGARFHHAAQAWNIAFYLQSLAAPAVSVGNAPSGAVLAAIEQRYGGPTALRARFDAVVDDAAGRGWTWLVRRREGGLGIVATSPGATPVTGDDRPLLAYARPARTDDGLVDGCGMPVLPLDAFWQLVDWRGVAARWSGAGH